VMWGCVWYGTLVGGSAIEAGGVRTIAPAQPRLAFLPLLVAELRVTPIRTSPSDNRQCSYGSGHYAATLLAVPAGESPAGGTRPVANHDILNFSEEFSTSRLACCGAW